MIDLLLAERVGRLLGAVPIHWEPAHRGYTSADRWVITMADGTSGFVKAATCEQTAEWLRDEYRVYAAVTGRFMPELRGWEDDGERPILLLEDLHEAHWPPPWLPGQVERLLSALAEKATAPVPDWLPSLEELRGDFSGWQRIAEDPRPFLSQGLCSRQWLDRALPVLLAAERAAVLEGPSLLHVDVRSDNLCFTGDRAVLVDWNWAYRGNPTVDISSWLPSLHAEGGPAPETILPDEPELAAMISGFWASRAEPPAGGMGSLSPLRRLRRELLTAAFPWAVRALSLPPLP
jgi:hypothetical protein